MVKNGLIFSLAIVLFIFAGCSKNNVLKPGLRFSTEAGFIHSNSIVSVGSVSMIRVYAESDGEDVLSRLVVRKNDTIVLDRNIQKANLSFDLSITKDTGIEESWEFIVKDEGSEESSVMIILFARAAIRGFDSPAIQAQKSPGERFYSIIHNHVYPQDEASLKSDSIDLMYYYSLGSKTSSLIGASNKIADTVYTGNSAPVHWISRKNTLFLPATSISTSEFDTLTTDWFLNNAFQRNKSEWINQSIVLDEGSLLYFRLGSGEYGIGKVVSIDESTTGSVVLSIKMQDFH